MDPMKVKMFIVTLSGFYALYRARDIRQFKGRLPVMCRNISP